MNRRIFLKNLSLLAGATIADSTLFSQLSFGQNLRANQNFIVIRMNGGWDVTLSLDPKTHGAKTTQEDIYIEYRPEDLLGSGNLKFGPAFAPMMNHYQSLAVINGILVNDSDTGHFSSLQYMTSGTTEISTDLIVEILSSTNPLPAGILADQTLSTGNRLPFITSINSLSGLATQPDIASFDQFLGNSTAQSKVYEAQRNFMKNKEIYNNLRTTVTESNKQMASGSINADQFKMHLIRDCFLSGASNMAQINLQFSLDTHASHPQTHMTEQTKAWSSISDLMSLFKQTPADSMGNSLFDNTTFLVLSEFSRTPALNAAEGKDHNPLTNSVLLAGRGVNAGRSFGESHIITKAETKDLSRHTGLPMNFSTGEAAHDLATARHPDFEYITPENIAATVARMMNVDWSKFKSVSQSVKPIASLIK